jgi:photosystem II stability/assembly factor-like uncharacterized protein
MAVYLQPNQNISGAYSGSVYAFGASGGFYVQQGFSQINLMPEDALSKYDVTDAVQIKFSARTLNKKLGILKDASNFNVIQAWFDPSHELLYTDSIKLCNCDLQYGVATPNVVSVGKLQSLYSDFKYCVSSYFGDPGGFASLFALEQEFDPNNGIFDASALVQVLNKSTFNINGSFVSDLSGSVMINDINRTLAYTIDRNLFNNRNPANKNWGVEDGFVAGDLIFIPEGLTITLSLNIQAEASLPINNVGPSYLDRIRNRLNWTRGYVTRNTTYTTTNITQTTTLPLLLIMTDVTLETYTNYGKMWVQVGSVANGQPQNWLGISVSSTGKYQSAITQAGDIFVTNDYGLTWTLPNNIGPSDNNSISISYTGQHQTVSNGLSIFVSNDFGANWIQTFRRGASQIFVTISLNGQYQTVVSCGDTVYISSDYGQTWNPIDPVENEELYYSVEGFPTAGIALSYNGIYQTIVTENIYISSDYGRTWENVSPKNNLDDRNWRSVAMASDGIYQTAIEEGGDIYVSTDYGNTWTYVDNPNLIDKQWESVSVSATGQYQTAIEKGGNIHTSIDYGQTWDAVPDPLVANKQWIWVSVSSDGIYQSAVDFGGHIYMSQVFANTTAHEADSCICL